MSNATAVWNTSGNGAIRIAASESWPLAIDGTIGWSLEMRQPAPSWQSGKKRTVTSDGLVPVVEDLPDGNRFVYNGLGAEEPFAALSLQLDIRLRGDDLVFSATVSGDCPGWVLSSFTFPVVGGIATEGAQLLWPNGLGQRFRDPAKFGRRVLEYPGGKATMPWFALTKTDGGLYLGSHDPEQSMREIAANVDAKTGMLDLSVKHQPFSGLAEPWTAPEFVVGAYTGVWQTAARRYRAWFDTAKSLFPAPAWTKDASGWLLAILKQQSGDVMWDYRTGIDHLCDLAEARGLDMIGLFGWAHGGHDRLYPDYIPDPLMGGKRALKAAIARAKERGLRTIIYANGIIMDTGTDFYRYEGADAIAREENRNPYISAIGKSLVTTPVTYARGCPGADRWRDRMMALAEQAHDLGADGILFDQMGVYPASLCYSEHHRHETPSLALTRERAAMLRDIAEAMQQRNPDFVVMTEAIHDTILDSIGYVHGWGFAYAPEKTDDTFPTMFRVTFPELPMTQRQANPMLDKHEGHFAVVHGLRHELEARYPADVRYLLDEAVPAADAYAEWAYPPDAEMLRRSDPAAAREYMHTLIAFERRHAKYLWHGRIMGDEGFELDNPALVANAFAAEDGAMAVCVWNPTDAPQACNLSVSGRELAECAEPGNETADAGAPLSAESIRIYVFR